MNAVESLKDAILNAAFPQSCHVCRRKVGNSRDGVACSSCWTETHFFDPAESHCLKCGGPTPSTNFSSIDCPTCRGHDYDRARFIALYEKAMSASILQLKSLPVLPRIVLDQISRFAVEDGLECDIVVPVPLSNKRRVERGFNQAEIISDAVARVLNVPTDAASLVRTVHTQMHRAAMDKKAREITVKNAFEVQRPKLLAGRRVLLVDDIFTSGATASYCARALKKARASSVHVLTLARAF